MGLLAFWQAQLLYTIYKILNFLPTEKTTLYSIAKGMISDFYSPFLYFLKQNK